MVLFVLLLWISVPIAIALTAASYPVQRWASRRVEAMVTGFLSTVRAGGGRR